MKKFLKIFWGILEVLIIIYVIVMTLLLLNKNNYGYTQIGHNVFINIDKMLKGNVSGAKIGDLLIIRDNYKIKKKDTIYYYYVSEDRYIVKNSEVKDVSNGIYTINEGYNIESSRVIGKKAIAIGFLGAFLKIAESKIGFILLVLVPILIVFIYQLVEFINVMKREDNLGD